jgi:hypothetical protein
MTRILLAALPVACIAWTVTQEEIFRELREWLCARHEDRRLAWWKRKAAYVPTCHFCFSHYVAAVVVPLFDLRLLASGWLGMVAAFFATVAMANVYISTYHVLRLALKWLRLQTERVEIAKQEAVRRAAAVRRPGAIGQDARLLTPHSSVWRSQAPSSVPALLRRDRRASRSDR